MTMKLLAKKSEAISEKGVSPALPLHEGIETDDTSHSRLGWWIVLVGFFGTLLWAALAPLDQGVPVTGTVTVATNRKTLQHPTGGIVDEILVKEGDVVKAGQVLVKLNETQAKSAAEMTRIQYFTGRAMEARLIAERDGAKELKMPAEVEKLKADPRYASVMQAQRQLFSARRSSLQSELAAIDESIAGLKMQMQGLQESLSNKKQQLVFLKEQLDNMRDLAKDGYVARNRLLDVERTYAQINGDISADIGNIGRGQKQISELILRRTQRLQDYQKEVRGQLADVQKEADALSSRLTSQEFDLSNTLVKAPVDGTIVGMNIFTKGGVVGSGFRMMDIVPSSDPLIVDGEVPTYLIDKVHPNLEVELIFSAFNQSKTPHIPGVVTQVSADRMVDERTGQAFYKMKAKVTPDGMKLLAKNAMEVRPGMPVEVFVKTGERSMLSYLLKPVIDRAHTALTEE
jgi:protease secretion system membrane fusion protein